MIEQLPAQLLQTLIRFDTSNPPGNERDCVRYIDTLLRSYGLQTQIFAKEASRPNLIARLPGRGEAPPLLLQGHVDVVPVSGQTWQVDPFAGAERMGMIWGRGALDMKGGVSMMICAVLRLAAAGYRPAGEILLCILSDEEDGGRLGARYLVEEHAEQFDGVRYSIGEFGGFPFYIGGVKFYPIQVAERVACRLKLTVRGHGGHAAVQGSSDTMATLGRVLTRLDERPLPIEVTPVTRMMLTTVAAHTPPPTNWIIGALRRPRLAARLLRLLPEQLGSLEPLLRNTANATIVHGGDKINVIPAEIALMLDGRMLPGCSQERLIAQLHHAIAEEVEIKAVSEAGPTAAEPDMTLYPLLAQTLQEADPTGVPLPFMLPAVTDGRWFGRLGIQHYGFLPMNLPPSFELTKLAHAADERIPKEALEFGAATLERFLLAYAG